MKLSAGHTRNPLACLAILLKFCLSVLLLLPLLTKAQFATVSVPIDGTPSLRICMTCHGAYGLGNKSVGGPKLAGMESWYLRKQLQGFRASFRGTQQDYIPGFEMRDAVSALSDVEIEDIVEQVSQWSDAPAQHTVSGDLANGKTRYQSCIACHGVSGEGNEALGAPSLTNRNDWYLLNQLKLYKSGYRGSHPEDSVGAQMRLMVQTLNTIRDMEDVIAYINTLE